MFYKEIYILEVYMIINNIYIWKYEIDNVLV